jgi:trimethylamine--corrinoid protein Co-methyltransferase
MTASFDKLVIDNEIIGMIMRAVEGIKVDDTTLAFDVLKKAGPGGHFVSSFDVLKKAGPGGHFVSSRHTRRYMRSEQFHPQLSDRDNRDRWESRGAKDTNVRATDKVLEILNGPAQSVLSQEIRERLKSEIPGLRSFLME